MVAFESGYSKVTKVIPNDALEVEYGQGGEIVTLPCGKPAVAECADCGASICARE
jgi:hypothetical protein